MNVGGEDERLNQLVELTKALLGRDAFEVTYIIIILWGVIRKL